MAKTTYRKRPTQYPQFVVTVTEEQLAALDAVIPDKMSRAEFVRRALQQMIGDDWPDNMPRRGKYERTPTD